MGDEQLLDETANGYAISAPDDLTAQQRTAALASSIAVWLGAMTLAELERLDAEQRRILAERDQTNWVRHPGDAEVWHCVDRIEHGMIRLLCVGSMPVSAKPDTENRPARADRCRLCQKRMRERRLLEMGLAELAAAGVPK